MTILDNKKGKFWLYCMCISIDDFVRIGAPFGLTRYVLTVANRISHLSRHGSTHFTLYSSAPVP